MLSIMLVMLNKSITGGKIDEYALSSNYTYTATYTDSLDISAQESNAQDLYFNNVARGGLLTQVVYVLLLVMMEMMLTNTFNNRIRY